MENNSNRQPQGVQQQMAFRMTDMVETGASLAFDLNRCDYMVVRGTLFVIPKQQNPPQVTQQGNVYQLPVVHSQNATPQSQPQEDQPKRGRPRGTTNKKKTKGKARRGRPPGSKNKPKPAPEPVQNAPQQAPQPQVPVVVPTVIAMPGVTAPPEAPKQEAPQVEAKPAPQTVTHADITLEKLPTPEQK